MPSFEWAAFVAQFQIMWAAYGPALLACIPFLVVISLAGRSISARRRREEETKRRLAAIVTAQSDARSRMVFQSIKGGR